MKFKIQPLLAGVVIAATSLVGVAQAQEKAPASSGSETVQMKVNAYSIMNRQKAVRIAQAELNNLGTPHVRNGILYFGKVRANGNEALADRITYKTGYVVSIGVKEGRSFERVATNLTINGKRAVGTFLDPNGAAYADVVNGKTYYGVTKVFGNQFDNATVPIKNASGKVVGYYGLYSLR